jgi:ankyrin repeat protein
MSDESTNRSLEVAETSIAALIENGEWESARAYCETHPEKVKELDPSTGGTVLHRLCTKPPAPIDLFQLVVKLFPEAVRIQEQKYLATPLHILCWTSQRTTGKVQCLLEHIEPDDLKLRNRFGGTVLHSACGSQASIDVIKQIVQKNPSIVAERTYEFAHTAFTALWHSHLQSIQGHMQIARILEGDEVDEGHFDRFWEKVVFLARHAFIESRACPENYDPESTGFELHGLMHLRAPINALKVAIKRHPEWAATSDDNDNYPLHLVVIRRPFRIKDVELIAQLLKAYPDAAGKKNTAGDAPVFIAIRDRMAWEDGLGDLVNANTDILGRLDTDTNLYPFLLTASLGGRVAVNTTYQLLCKRPDLVRGAIS